jgi:hypothetical protein
MYSASSGVGDWESVARRRVNGDGFVLVPVPVAERLPLLRSRDISSRLCVRR